MAPTGPRRIPSGPATLGDNEWRALREFVLQHTGVSLSPSKRSLVIARLGKRLVALNLESFVDYVSHLMHHDPLGEERQQMINAITTHKSLFFREAGHFDFLAQRCVEARRTGAMNGGLRVWCAACSNGQEAYTLAAVLSRSLSPGDWAATKILATDIDTDVLARAAEGRYPRSVLEEVPLDYQDVLFESATEGELRVRTSLRRVIHFEQRNLVRDTYSGSFDVIFCRNVLIYFDAPTRRSVIERMTSVLRPAGLLFLAHAEALPLVPSGLTQVSTAVYERTDLEVPKGPHPNAPQIGAAGWARVCVRDGILLSIRSSESGLCGVIHLGVGQLSQLSRRLVQVSSVLRTRGEVLQGKLIRVQPQGASAPLGMAARATGSC